MANYFFRSKSIKKTHIIPCKTIFFRSKSHLFDENIEENGTINGKRVFSNFLKGLEIRFSRNNSLISNLNIHFFK